MRRFLFFITILYSFCTHAQVQDDFSDGDFTENPTWSGDTELFQVNKALQLRLNDRDEKKGNAYLSTPSYLIRNTEWSLYVHLYFNPSANNYAKFYLASSSANLNEALQGYYLLIGGADDNVSLYRQDGFESYELIKGVSKMVGKSSPELQIKVVCDEAGNWKLYTCLLKEENDYVLEGSTADKTFTETSFIGLVCVYTASRNTAFAFDDIYVKPLLLSNDDEEEDDENEKNDEEEDGNEEEDDGDDDEKDDEDKGDPDDKTPPVLTTVLAINDSTLLLTFDEKVVVSDALFQVNGYKETKRLLYEDKKNLELTFYPTFTDREEYTLFISRIADLSGNIMGDRWITFSYYDPELQAMCFGDIVFTEIMANPKYSPVFPEVEYIEIYNRTGYPVNLRGWTFYYGMKGYKLENMIILPESYLVLCNKKEINQWSEFDLPVYGVSSFPVLANSGKLLWLEDARENVITWVEYSDSWYEDDFKKKGGFSLECIDADNLSNDKRNWKASVSEEGGTPGKVNSVKSVFPDQLLPEIAYAYMLNPDTVYIHFTKPMDISVLNILDNYTVIKGDASPTHVFPIVPTGQAVKLLLDSDLQEDEVLEIEMRKLIDVSGFGLQGEAIIKVALPGKAESGDLFFNEILFNPFPGGSDYVEVYNHSEKYIRLDQLMFTSRKEDGSLTEGIPLFSSPRTFAPDSYLCFSKDIEGVCEQYECEVRSMVSINKLPSLPDTKGNILLTDFSGAVIDEFIYTEKMHNAFLDDREGVALEKVRPEVSSLVVNNWLSASSASGGGTPGYQNSQYRGLEDNSEEGFWLESRTFTPDGDGLDDLLVIHYELTIPDVFAHIKVYDVAGRLVTTLVENYRLEETGVFIWDGSGMNGNVSPMGLYIIYVEAYTSEGWSRRYKLGCALTR